MLCSVPADTVNTQIFQLADKLCNDLLYILMFRVQIRHTDVAVRYLPAVAPVNVVGVCVEFCIMEILILVQVALNGIFSLTACITCKVVGNNVNDDLDTVFVGFRTKSSQILCRTVVITDRKTQRLIEPEPSTRCVMGLYRRSLYAGKTCLCDLSKRGCNVADFPVKAMKNVAVRDIVGQSVVACCIDFLRTGSHQRTAKTRESRGKK